MTDDLRCDNCAALGTCHQSAIGAHLRTRLYTGWAEDERGDRARGRIPDIAGLVRRAADGDLKAWERLVTSTPRLIWSITAEFKLAESDAADAVQTTWLRLLEHIDRIEYPERSAPGWRRPRNECLPSRAARKRVASATTTPISTAPPAQGPEIDERLLADKPRSGRPRGALQPATAVATAARAAYG
jgi:hypothetical protein